MIREKKITSVETVTLLRTHRRSERINAVVAFCRERAWPKPRKGCDACRRQDERPIARRAFTVKDSFDTAVW
jgi:Asp-tRNA(Asn)/Glu-tRNA(Gln) amidotransferase A subunit family amidase